MSGKPRKAVLEQLCASILAVEIARPLRLAIDGRTASGKTTFADELAALVEARGRKPIRTSIDGFHRPRAERYARGRYSAEGYYLDARDLAAIRSLLLAPLGPGGDRRYRTASFDLETDRPVEQIPMTASRDSVLIVDGTFLQRPELRGHFDLAVFLDTSESISENRGMLRDAERLGGMDEARRLYAERYRLALHFYEEACQPSQLADAVVNNDDLDHPRIVVRLHGRLWNLGPSLPFGGKA
jgi:uridine kinase